MQTKTNDRFADLGFYRVAAATLPVQVGDVDHNTAAVLQKLRQAAEAGVDVLVCPELCLTGYTCGALFLQQPLQAAAVTALVQLTLATAELPTALAVGLPLALAGGLYNCAALAAGGRLLGLVPKTFLPNHNEFYERRWFSAASDLPQKQLSSAELGLPGDPYPVPVGRDLLFCWHGLRFGLEVCEDLWAPLPPSSFLALGGALAIFNLSASDEAIGKRDYRRQLVCQQSARCLAAYIYASAGAGESTTDLVFSGHLLVAENGQLLAENPTPLAEDDLLVQDIDTQRLTAERLRSKTFAATAALYGPLQPLRVLPPLPRDVGASAGDGGLYPLHKLPFVPSSSAGRRQRCQEIFSLQVAGLCKRLAVTGAKPVVGVSGGLDSTLALLVAVGAMARLGRPVGEVYGLTMPCFGTTGRTYQNALALMRALGVTVREIPIKEACQGHFADIGHDPAVTDTTYENCQARERTQVLMDFAGMVGGLVVGTGDLSELALGWCTYNADHMSMYGVNASIPKTLVRWMVDTLAAQPDFAAAADVLRDILDTPISPELLPPDADGNIAQQTEALVGPYALHDFFLYYVLRWGFGPTKIFALARRAFAKEFSDADILHWLETFYRRFFSQQFKRSCLPDGVKVGSVCLSPRGDWRMPSDASAALWLAEGKNLQIRFAPILRNQNGEIPLRELYIGTYTDGTGSEGIYRLLLTPDGRLADAQPKAPQLVAAQRNPSWLLFSADGNVLYAVQEDTLPENVFFKKVDDIYQGGGWVHAYRRAGDDWHPFGKINSGGNKPCHLAFWNGYLVVVNYGDEDARSWERLGTGISLIRCNQWGALSQIDGQRLFRESAHRVPHAHFAATPPQTDVLWVTDLGSERLWTGGATGDDAILQAQKNLSFGDTPKHFGPRHLAFHPTLRVAYVVGELGNRLRLLTYEQDGQVSASRAKTALSTLPADFTGPSYAAAVRVHPNGRWVYVSNRGHDSVAAFPLDADGQPGDPLFCPTGGAWPRDILLAPDGSALLCANQRSNSITRLPLAADGSLLPGAPIEHLPAPGAPVCLTFAPGA